LLSYQFRFCKIADINTKVKNLGSDTKHIDAVVQGAQTMSGAFSVASSASALLGSENEDLQKTMLKVESAIGLTVGIQSVANALQKESALVIGATNLATKAQIAVQTAWTAATVATTGATKALKVALISSGVGAIVVALGFLVEHLMSASDATEDLAREQELLNDQLKETNNLYKQSIKDLEDVTNERVLRAKIAGKSTKELAQIEKEAYNDRIESYKVERDRLFSLLDDKRTGAEQSKEINKQLAENQKEYTDFLSSQTTKELEGQLEVINARKDAEQKAADEAKSRREKEAEERKKAKEQEAQEFKEFQDIIFQANKDQFDLEIQEKISQGERDLEWQTEIANQSDAINKEFLDKEKADSDAKLLLKQKEKEATESHLSQTAGLLDGFSEIVGKHTAAGKAMAVATATINTFKGVSEVWGAASMGNPIVDMVIKIASTALVVASGIANVKKILSVKVPGNGGGGGGAITGVSAPTPPSFNIVGQNQNNQLAQSIAGRQNQPIEAYVVAGNVTNAQSADRNRIGVATFN